MEDITVKLWLVLTEGQEARVALSSIGDGGLVPSLHVIVVQPHGESAVPGQLGSHTPTSQ
jgi:hypothetical protein